jgi:Zn-dependent protease with chaperone function
MTPALILFGYAATAGWLVPAPLARLTASGTAPRLAIAAWLAAIASVLLTALVAISVLIRDTVTGWPGFARNFCQTVSDSNCPPQVYRSALFELSLAAATVLVVLAAAVAAWRFTRRFRGVRRRTQAHGEAARITGQPFTGQPLPSSATAVVLPADRPAVYCVPGRPATIVLTTGALSILGPAELGAVLAHERAHLAGRHHLLTGLSGCLLPVVPLFKRGAAEIARLVELRADDVAARHGDRTALARALVTMATGAAFPVPSRALAATGHAAAGHTDVGTGAVTARLHRLLTSVPRARRLWQATALAGVIVILTALPTLLTAVA